MKKFAALMGFVVLVSMLCTSVYGFSFLDDFEDGDAKDWTSGCTDGSMPRGYWSTLILSGIGIVYAGDGDSSPCPLVSLSDTVPPGNDYTVEAKMQMADVKADSSQGIIGRAVDLRNFYALTINVGASVGQKWTLRKAVGGTWTTITGGNDIVLSRGGWYELKMKFKGHSIQCFIGGVRMCQVEDSAVRGAKFGVHADGVESYFDDIRVYDAAGARPEDYISGFEILYLGDKGSKSYIGFRADFKAGAADLFNGLTGKAMSVEALLNDELRIDDYIRDTHGAASAELEIYLSLLRSFKRGTYTFFPADPRRVAMLDLFFANGAILSLGPMETLWGISLESAVTQVGPGVFYGITLSPVYVND